MKECSNDMIAASMRTLVIVGSPAELKLPPQLPLLRTTLWPTRTQLFAIRPSVASEPSLRMMLESVEPLVSLPSLVGRTITSLAAAMVSGLEYAPLIYTLPQEKGSS